MYFWGSWCRCTGEVGDLDVADVDVIPSVLGVGCRVWQVATWRSAQCQYHPGATIVPPPHCHWHAAVSTPEPPRPPGVRPLLVCVVVPRGLCLALSNMKSSLGRRGCYRIIDWMTTLDHCHCITWWSNYTVLQCKPKGSTCSLVK